MADNPNPTSPGPSAGDPNARKGVEGNVHGHADNPAAQLWMALSGASAGGHHEEIPGVDEKAAKVGHEADQFPARTIVYVPIVVAIALVVTYLVVQMCFSFVNGKESQMVDEARTTDPARVAEVDEANKKRVKEFNDRTGRIRTTTADGLEDSRPGEQPAGPVAQPGLEYVRQVDRTRLGPDGKPITDPPFVRSLPSTGTNNSPEIYPEDLRPDVFVDPYTHTRMLAEPQWAVKDKLAVVPIDEMIHLVTTDAQWKGVLKVAAKPADVHPGTLGKPKISTGGVTPPLPPKGEAKKDDGHGHK